MGAFAIDQGTYHVAKGTQRQVNFLSLFQSIASGLGLALPLRARQVNEVKFADSKLLLTVRPFFSRFDIDSENRVRT